MQWKYEKFNGFNDNIYAICPKCGFLHQTGQLMGFSNFGGSGLDRYTPIIDNNYNYCPICGEYLYVDTDKVDVVINERYISELHND